MLLVPNDRHEESDRLPSKPPSVFSFMVAVGKNALTFWGLWLFRMFPEISLLLLILMLLLLLLLLLLQLLLFMVLLFPLLFCPGRKTLLAADKTLLLLMIDEGLSWRSKDASDEVDDVEDADIGWTKFWQVNATVGDFSAKNTGL